jgi:hypothetical protein
MQKFGDAHVFEVLRGERVIHKVALTLSKPKKQQKYAYYSDAAKGANASTLGVMHILSTEGCSANRRAKTPLKLNWTRSITPLIFGVNTDDKKNSIASEIELS